MRVCNARRPLDTYVMTLVCTVLGPASTRLRPWISETQSIQSTCIGAAEAIAESCADLSRPCGLARVSAPTGSASPLGALTALWGIWWRAHDGVFTGAKGEEREKKGEEIESIDALNALRGTFMRLFLLHALHAGLAALHQGFGMDDSVTGRLGIGPIDEHESLFTRTRDDLPHRYTVRFLLISGFGTLLATCLVGVHTYSKLSTRSRTRSAWQTFLTTFFVHRAGARWSLVLQIELQFWACALRWFSGSSGRAE